MSPMEDTMKMDEIELWKCPFCGYAFTRRIRSTTPWCGPHRVEGRWMPACAMRLVSTHSSRSEAEEHPR